MRAAARCQGAPARRPRDFFLKLIPAPVKNRDSIPVSAFTPRSPNNRAANALSVMSGCAAITANNHARSGCTFEGRCPPVPAPLRSPVLCKRWSHLIADALLTPNRRAAARRLIPSRCTASITRSRKSWEYARAICCSPPSSASQDPATPLRWLKQLPDSIYSQKTLELKDRAENTLVTTVAGATVQVADGPRTWVVRADPPEEILLEPQDKMV